MGQQIYTTGSGTFNVPEGATDLIIEVFGGGGGGLEPPNTNGAGNGGGGGGGYASITIASPASSYTYSVGGGGAVGSAGGSSTINTNLLIAEGGGAGTTTTGGAGGSGSGSGATTYTGGSGSKPATGSGAGGGGAGSSSNGSDAVNQTGGAGGTGNPDGTGGAGATGNNGDGTAGTGYGGGGGSGTGRNGVSQAGASGAVIFSWTLAEVPPAPTNVSATKGTHTDKVVVTWTKSVDATGYKVYEGTNLLSTLGDVDTYDDTTAGEPSITPGSASASDGTSTAHVSLSLSGSSANNGATRTYKVVATNDVGDSADSSTDTGYRGIGSLTYQWQRSSSTTDADYSDIVGATTATYDDTGAPSNGDIRWYRCVLNALGATQQISTSNSGYRGEVSDGVVKLYVKEDNSFRRVGRP